MYTEGLILDENTINAFTNNNSEALKTYLKEKNENPLTQVYELARMALTAGIGIMELIEVYQRSTSIVLPQIQNSVFCVPTVVSTSKFLAESLSPYEMALRGYKDANRELQYLNQTLTQQVSERTKKLQETELKYRQLVEDVPAIVYTAKLETELQMLYVSPRIETILGFKPHTWISMPTLWKEQIHPDDRVRIIYEMRNSMLTAKPFSAEYRLFTVNKREVWVHDQAHVVFDKEQHSYLLHGVMLDITKQKEFEFQFLQAQKMKSIGNLASGITHDFNNLLAVIISYAQVDLKETPIDSLLHEDLNEILMAAQRAADLSQRLLMFSHKHVAQTKFLNLNYQIEELEKMLRHVLRENIDLSINLAPNIGIIQADPHQIDQVILNLVINARDAMPTGGKLIIETQNDLITETFSSPYSEVKPGTYIRLRIQDTGIGMSQQVKERLFEPFFTTKELGKGTGLGLATSWQIIKQSAGFITVDSKVGVGTTFDIYLPSADEKIVIPQTFTDKKNLLETGNEVLLLVDDNVALRKVLARVLQNLGYQIEQASNVDDTLGIIQSPDKKIDLIISDIIMLKRNGLELGKYIKEHHMTIKILSAAGSLEVGNIQEVVEFGYAFIQKPFNYTELTHKIRELLDQK